jgi:hypothetical protein
MSATTFGAICASLYHHTTADPAGSPAGNPSAPCGTSWDESISAVAVAPPIAAALSRTPRCPSAEIDAQYTNNPTPEATTITSALSSVSEYDTRRRASHMARDLGRPVRVAAGWRRMRRLLTDRTTAAVPRTTTTEPANTAKSGNSSDVPLSSVEPFCVTS